MRRVVVFDTGTGGKIFAEHFKKSLGDTEIIEVLDFANAPYGSRSPQEIAYFTEKALGEYLETDAIIVIACNTATAYAIDDLRKKYPQQQFVGTEPAIKPASELTKNGQILVLATPATLNSPRERRLEESYGYNLAIHKPDCSRWAMKIDGDALSADEIRETLSPFKKYNPDVIVLACTHFLAIAEDTFASIFPNATVYSPLASITARVESLL